MLTKEDLLMLSLKNNDIQKALPIIYQHLDSLKSASPRSRINSRKIINRTFHKTGIDLVITASLSNMTKGTYYADSAVYIGKVCIPEDLLFYIFDLPVTKSMGDLYV